MATAIDTGKVTGRRKLHFNTIEDIRADVEGLANSRDVRALGNLSPGQNLEHLATTFNKSIDGYQTQLPSPVRLVFRVLLKNKFLNQPMTAGFKLPAKAQAELVPGATPLEQGLNDIRRALGRLDLESQRAPSPVLGPLTRDEWNQLHCRHAELHLSFLVPVD